MNNNKYTATTGFSRTRFGLVVVIGLLVGVLTWLVSLLLRWAFVEPVFCRSADSFNACANGGTIAIVVALILVNFLGLFALIRLGVYRPLLVVLAAVVTLWGVHSWLGGLSWYEASLWYGLVFAVSYILYAWLARLVSFGIAAGLTLLAVIMFRFFMTHL